MRWLSAKYAREAPASGCQHCAAASACAGLEVRSQRSQVHRRVRVAGHPLPLPRQQHTDPMDPEPAARHAANPSGQDTWSARCGGGAARRVREGGRGRRPVATPAPRPRAYLTTALRETKASLDGAGPSARADAPLRLPDLVRQELAAWAAANEMTRGIARAAASPPPPPERDAAPGSACRPARSPTAAPAAPSSPRSAPAGPAARRWPGNSRNTGPSSTGTGTAPARPSAPAPSPRRPRRDRTRIAAAVITLANTPA